MSRRPRARDTWSETWQRASAPVGCTEGGGRRGGEGGEAAWGLAQEAEAEAGNSGVPKRKGGTRVGQHQGRAVRTNATGGWNFVQSTEARASGTFKARDTPCTRACISSRWRTRALTPLRLRLRRRARHSAPRGSTLRQVAVRRRAQLRESTSVRGSPVGARANARVQTPARLARPSLATACAGVARARVGRSAPPRERGGHCRKCHRPPARVRTGAHAGPSPRVRSSPPPRARRACRQVQHGRRERFGGREGEGATAPARPPRARSSPPRDRARARARTSSFGPRLPLNKKRAHRARTCANVCTSDASCAPPRPMAATG